ncbi:MAG: hypothetical protein K9J17_13770 [Flavobacteriales bacterium]|nr:hypothetical protein [Flavobacteriales bacterium]
MEIIVKSLLFLHVSFGFTSLLLFWLPVFMKKGGKGHRVVGKLYVLAMWVVVTSAALLCIKNVIIGKYFMAVFLGFISLITANPLWYGMAILKPRVYETSAFHWKRTAFDGLIVLAGALMLVYGIILEGKDSAVLMLIFGCLGLTGIPSFIKNLKGPREKEDRIRLHMIGMLTSGIAAYTAFFVFGGYTWMSKLLPGMWGILPWTAPGLIGAIGINYGVKYFRKKGMISEQH